MISFINKQNLAKLLLESILIIFSVLLALLLNEYRTSLREQKLKKSALENVEKEIINNLATVKEWLPYHTKVLKNIQNALKDPATQKTMLKNGEIYYWEMMPRGFVQSLIYNTAWEIMKDVNTQSNLDFEIMLKLSNLYKLQEEGVQATIHTILNHMNSREALKTANLPETLLLLRNGFRELVSQEEFLIHTYQNTLETLHPSNEEN